LRRYETIFIADANISGDDLGGIIERSKTIITGLKGIVVKVEEWGKRKLAYEIRKQSRGSYILIDYVGKSDVVAELERNFKIDDKILKFQTVKKSERVDLQKIEEEIAAAAKKVEKVEDPASPSGNTTIQPKIIIEKNTLSEDPNQSPGEASVQPEAPEPKEDVKGEDK
jgi:small subunit ribosomal protein S6